MADDVSIFTQVLRVVEWLIAAVVGFWAFLTIQVEPFTGILLTVATLVTIPKSRKYISSRVPFFPTHTVLVWLVVLALIVAALSFVGTFTLEFY
jgi:hypothetical protein